MGILAKIITELGCNEKEARLVCLDLIASIVTYPAEHSNPIEAIREHLTDYANAFPDNIIISLKAERWAAKQPLLKIVGGRAV